MFWPFGSWPRWRAVSNFVHDAVADGFAWPIAILAFDVRRSRRVNHVTGGLRMLDGANPVEHAEAICDRNARAPKRSHGHDHAEHYLPSGTYAGWLCDIERSVVGDGIRGGREYSAPVALPRRSCLEGLFREPFVACALSG